jgi:hypothetical protein
VKGYLPNILSNNNVSKESKIGLLVLLNIVNSICRRHWWDILFKKNIVKIPHKVMKAIINNGQ